MEKKLDTKIIEEFRSIMNDSDNSDVLSDRNGIDDYSFICSQMDWIEAWVNELEKIDIKAEGFHTRTVNQSQLILGVDMIVSASKNLLDYFNYDTAQLEKDKSIFKETITDYKYFRRIRSIFAIHPIDINIKTRKTREKKFASWSANAFRTDEITIFLYSQVPNTPSEEITIERGQLINFSLKWYKELQMLNDYFKYNKTIFKTNNSLGIETI